MSFGIVKLNPSLLMMKLLCNGQPYETYQSWGFKGQMPKNIYWLYLSIDLIRHVFTAMFSESVSGPENNL